MNSEGIHYYPIKTVQRFYFLDQTRFSKHSRISGISPILSQSYSHLSIMLSFYPMNVCLKIWSCGDSTLLTLRTVSAGGESWGLYGFQLGNNWLLILWVLQVAGKVSHMSLPFVSPIKFQRIVQPHVNHVEWRYSAIPWTPSPTSEMGLPLGCNQPPDCLQPEPFFFLGKTFTVTSAQT